MEKIALDLDGVVFDSENLYRVYIEIYNVEKNGEDLSQIIKTDNFMILYNIKEES